MTKAIFCRNCAEVVGPKKSGLWAFCECEYSGVRWRDSKKGHLEVTSQLGSSGLLIFGLHNGMIEAAMEGHHSHEDWQHLHDDNTDAPGYLFDKDKRNCWAVIIHVGESNDVWFIPYGDVQQEVMGGAPQKYS